MKTLEITLQSLEPLALTSGSPAGIIHDCLDYIPGNLLLGAFAHAWIRRNRGVNPDSSPQFQDLFLTGDTRWGCAMPLCGNEPCVPVPLCYRREKAMAGLPVEGAQAGEFAVFNLLPLADGESPAQYYRERFRGDMGAEDDESLKFKKVSATFMNPESLCQPDLRKVWNTRVALGERRSALEGQLFGFTALAPGLLFRARVECPDTVAAALDNLAQGMDKIRVGHARSAGYGMAAISCSWVDKKAPQKISGTAFNLFLLTPYAPDPSWEEPLPNLLSKIGEKTSSKPEIGKDFLAYTMLEGFNTHWKKPRDSRRALAGGSVCRLIFPKPVTLDAELCLGGSRLEGYGKILVNPAFLEDAMPKITLMPGARPEPTQPTPQKPRGPVWGILEKRVIARLAKRQAEKWLCNEHWTRFLESVSKNQKPGASQVANVLNMDQKAFESMLGKTPGAQWKGEAASNPFAEKGRDFLVEIMRKLLDQDVFLRAFSPDYPQGLPFGESGEKEFKKASYGHFRRELLRAWIRLGRA